MVLYKSLRVVLLLLVSCNSINSNTSVEGVYQSISESELAVTLTLLSGGKAQIKLENWEAGAYDKRDIKVVAGNWSANSNKIFLEYEGVEEVLTYTDSLALAEVGKEGSSPGLLQVPPIETRSIIHGIKLWKKDGKN